MQTIRERLGVDKSEQVILSVGRLSKEKAHADLIAAFQYFCQNETSLTCKLVIVGDGPERARLEAQAAETGFGRKLFSPDRLGTSSRSTRWRMFSHCLRIVKARRMFC